MTSEYACQEFELPHQITNGAMRKGDHPNNIAPFLTLSLTLVPARNRRVYERQCKRDDNARQPNERK